ncbi:MAG: LCP family protein [Ruminococcus sp.]|nr:LCP family protein [Ruminococcus sp.]
MKNQLNNNANNESKFSKEQLDSIEYVTPIKREKHKKSESGHSSTKEVLEDSNDYVFAKPHKKIHNEKKKMSRPLKITVIVFSVIALILILSVTSVVIFNQIGKSQMHDYENMNIDPYSNTLDELDGSSTGGIDGIESVSNNGKTIKYKGTTYNFNEDVATVVFMGVDTTDPQYKSTTIGKGGQADVIYVAVIDTKNSKLSMLNVSRDTMVDVDVYNTEGGFVRTEPMQVCLSYAYGDGKEKSCENTLNSLERILFGVEFNTYYSIDQNCIVPLNDAIGGVTVTSSYDFESENYGSVKKGETVTLHGKDAIRYIRPRDTSKLDSNSDRMKRQQEYLRGFFAQAIPAVKKDKSVVTDLMGTISDNSTTNLNASKATYLTTTALRHLDSYKDIEFVNIEGKFKKGEYAEFYPDQQKLFENMLSLFYNAEK